MKPIRILLGRRNGMSIRATRLVLIASGVFLLVTNVFDWGADLGDFWDEYWLLPELWGVLMIGLGLVRFSNTPWAPRVEIDEDRVLLKPRFWKRAEVVPWSSISSVEFRSYHIILHKTRGTSHFHYEVNPEVSIAVKKSLREIAEKKGIEVQGG